VGMTRAEETLTLCEFDSGNSFSRQLSREALQLAYIGEYDPRLERCYLQLNLSEIDIGFAGRSVSSSEIHRAIADVQIGHSLTFKHQGDRYLLLDSQGRVVGRMAKSFKPNIEVDQCHAEGIVTRYAEEGDPQFHAATKVDQWEVVIPRISGMLL
jgi:ATP-dependent DNA helicase RecQ